MPPRLPTQLPVPIAFAHRGARAHAPENTLEAFLLAREMGATGLESDVWRSSDGVAVLDHDGVVRQGVRRRPIAQLLHEDLPEHIPTLVEYYEQLGVDLPLSLDVKDPDALAPTVAAAVAAGASGQLWLCHPDLATLQGWRGAVDAAKLVHSTHLKAMKGGPERHAARLRELGIHAVNLHHTEWSGGLIALFHRFGIVAFGWDAQHERILRELFDSGIDGVFSDHVDLLMQAVLHVHGPAAAVQPGA